MKELENPRIESKVNSFVEKGNELHDDKKYAQALEQYEKAWSILPEPKPEWQVANWISANIFSAYFDLGDYNEAKKWGEMTLQTRGSEIDTAPSIWVWFVMSQSNLMKLTNILTMLIGMEKREHLKVDLRSTLSFF